MVDLVDFKGKDIELVLEGLGNHLHLNRERALTEFKAQLKTLGKDDRLMV